MVLSDGEWIPFLQLDGIKPAFLCTDVLVPPEWAMVIQAKVYRDEGVFMFADKQSAKSTSKINVASMLIKCRRKRRVTLEIVNVTKIQFR